MQLSYEDVRPVLDKLASTNIVLVGGQALNFWAEHYRDRAPELAAAAPFTSKDIDYCGTRSDVVRCAKILGGTPYLPRTFDPPSVGKVVFQAQRGEIELDFIDRPFGLKADDVEATSIPIDVLDDDGLPVGSFRVMHPERCMESRVHNFWLSDGRTDLARKQLAASVPCTREFMRDLAEQGEVRAVLKLAERIFKFCMRTLHGKQILALAGVDPFACVEPLEKLPAKFNEVRLPQMRAQLAHLRQRLARRTTGPLVT